MAYSRVEKYQELRDGLKDEAGINREKVVEDVVVDDEDDDFLSFIKKNEKPAEKPVDLEDTLTEAKTFEQMRQEGSKELEQALRSAKEGVGKESQFNTRMDILSKIREPEKVTIKIDSVEKYRTDEFARGMFLNDNNQDSESVEEEKTESKKKMTLMEKLASISPEEDAKKAQEFLQQEQAEQEETNADIEENKDVFEEQETIADDIEIENNDIEDFEEDNEEYDDETTKKDSKIVKILDVIIVILVIALLVLLGVIIYQNFF